MSTYNRNLPHPSTLTSSEWATPHEAVAPVQLVQNVFHLAGGLLGNMFNSSEVGTSWDETRFYHYVNTERPWKAASLYRQFRRNTLRDVKVDQTVQWYLDYLEKTGEFAYQQLPAPQQNVDLDALAELIIAKTLAMAKAAGQA
jgi:hypothetical protein